MVGKKQLNRFFLEIINSENKLIIWQHNESTNKRVVFDTFIAGLDNKLSSVSCQTIDDIAFDLNPGTVFLYNEKTKSICKTNQVSNQNNFLSIHFPEELVVLEDDLNDKMKCILESVNPDLILDKPKEHKMLYSDKGKKLIIADKKAG